MSNPNHLVCVACQRFFHRLKNGVRIEEGRPIGPVGWGPYKVWVADHFKCEGCGAEIIAGFAEAPLAEHYQPEYEKRAASALFRVDDCPGGPYKARPGGADA